MLGFPGNKYIGKFVKINLFILVLYYLLFSYVRKTNFQIFVLFVCIYLQVIIKIYRNVTLFRYYSLTP